MSQAVSEPRHIALVGFMGSGKSTVGSALAKALGREFVDLDALISEATGKSIGEIFREHGEVAFRAQERAALRGVLARPTPLVIATGGGTYIDPATRLALHQAATCVYLRGELDNLWARLSTADIAARPLLAGPDAKANAARLLSQRAPIYAECDVQIDTDHRSVDAVVGDIIRALGLQMAAFAETAAAARGELPRLHITAAARTYAVELRTDAGPWLAEAVCRACPQGDVVIFTDANVGALHGPALLESLRVAGRNVLLHTFPAGEDSKSLATAGQLYDVLLTAGIRRNGVLIALGGGVVGDLTGFVASTYLRGIAYVQVPTTTLAAVDSSVGGKTAVNTPRGKNLVGTFYPPHAVLIAAAHLSTQSQLGNVCGLVEALKMSSTHDAALFAHMRSQAEALVAMQPDALLEVVGRAIAIKAGVVSRDEREVGERAVLNVGHTVGHAIEAGARFQLQHGEAVALGMVAETEFATITGLCDASVLPALIDALSALKMPTEWRRVKIDLEALELDKKRLGVEVVLPVIRTLGTYALCQVPLANLVAFAAQRT